MREQLSGLAWAVWRRNLDVFSKTWQVNLIPPAIEPVLYLLALGFGVGAFITEIEGVPYIRFIAPALFAVSVMNASFFECTYGSYVRMYYQKTFDAIVATPVTIEEVIAGEILWGATRSLISAGIILPVLVLFGVVDLPGSLLLVPFAFAAGLLFASIGMCFTAVIPNIESINYPAFLFITPMFLFSGTFFPLDLLPGPLKALALAVLPLAHVVNVARALTLSTGWDLLFLGLLWIGIATPLLFLLALRLMKRRLIV
ncbi:ABC transporter permease [Methanofollis aquaemaris]|uniref:ABC transporter permease n=1 Tax=Methanofollis aquaemaris TaxID=126734 RepID=A0A8A3S5M0_9EURY|nr:ABC transporter permease [Methanofollis aquaemaris]QSZ67435.1 ABC transporter permease [Methanofollis aquaemaris]